MQTRHLTCAMHTHPPSQPPPTYMQAKYASQRTLLDLGGSGDKITVASATGGGSTRRLHSNAAPMCSVDAAGYENWPDLQWPSSRFEERDPKAAEARAVKRAAMKARRTTQDLRVKAISSHPDLALPVARRVADDAINILGEPWPSSRWSGTSPSLGEEWPSSRWEDPKSVSSPLVSSRSPRAWVSSAVTAAHSPETVARTSVRSTANRIATVEYLNRKTTARRESEQCVFSELHEAM
jgi:hypothetical protein